VYPVNPARLNQRLIIQQGVFLCPTDIRVSFEDSFVATERAIGRRLRLIRFTFDRGLLQDAITALYRMNMQPATLFPGLDGYSRNLRPRLHFLSTSNLFDETDL